MERMKNEEVIDDEKTGAVFVGTVGFLLLFCTCRVGTWDFYWTRCSIWIQVGIISY